MSLKGINAYKKGSVKQEVSTADPHRLTLLLMQGALDRVAYAKGAIERKDFESKAEFISKSLPFCYICVIRWIWKLAARLLQICMACMTICLNGSTWLI